jgi:hypothetical protein
MTGNRRRFPAALVRRGTPGRRVFIVRDATGQALCYLYFEDEPVRQMSMKRLSDEARRIAANIAKLPDFLRKPQARRLWAAVAASHAGL